jgi:hypothetical protein
MTLTTLITLNAILATAVVSGILWLLIAGIRSDSRFRKQHLARLHTRRARRESDRIAA